MCELLQDVMRRQCASFGAVCCESRRAALTMTDGGARAADAGSKERRERWPICNLQPIAQQWGVSSDRVQRSPLSLVVALTRSVLQSVRRLRSAPGCACLVTLGARCQPLERHRRSLASGDQSSWIARRREHRARTGGRHAMIVCAICQTQQRRAWWQLLLSHGSCAPSCGRSGIVRLPRGVRRGEWRCR